MKDLQTILKLARTIGWEAADILQSYYHQSDDASQLEVKDKKDGPVTAADIAANHHILHRLQTTLIDEDFGYLSEETYNSETGKLNNPWVWIIDPLDGTRDFINKTGEYALHIALAFEGSPVLSVVGVPSAQKLYYATKEGGAFVETREGNIQQLQVSARDRIEDFTLVASRSHRDQRLNKLLENLPCKNQKFVGSVGGKIASIIEQQADIYISLSGKSAPKDWDMAAPELILTEAGGKFTHFDGTPLKYNTGDVNQWGGLLASNGHCHQVLCEKLASSLAEIDGGSQ
jgi:3'(2'), 5'-bisphosphate nucleotidase